LKITLVTRLAFLVLGHKLSHVAQSGEMIIGPGKHHRSARRARRPDIELSKPNPNGGQRVDIRGSNLASKAADVRDPGVIRNNEQDIGPEILLSAQ